MTIVHIVVEIGIIRHHRRADDRHADRRVV
jgi:hypothetical protein